MVMEGAEELERSCPSGTWTGTPLEELCGREIVVISHGFQTSYERGFCNALAVNKLTVTLVSSDRTDYAGLDKGVKFFNYRGSQSESRSLLQKIANLTWYHTRLVLLTWRKRRSIVHVVGLLQPPLFHGVVEGSWFRLISLRYVLTIHDLLPHDNHSPWMAAMYWLAYRLPHRFVVHTHGMAVELVRRFGVNPTRIVVMEHGLEPLTSCPTELPRDIDTAHLRLLFFGNVMHYKGLDILLAAVAKLGRPFSLHVSGVCIDGQLRSKLKRVIRDSPVASSITWRNEFATEAEMAGLFLQTDAVVLPYRHIDQSGVLFQAFRFGLPVIATRVGSLEEYVTEEIGELCAPESVDALRDAIERFAQRKAELRRDRIIDIGRRFDWSLTVRSLAPAYAHEAPGDMELKPPVT